MILTLSQIKDIIINNPGKARVAKGREYSKKMRRHIYGEGLEQHIATIEGFERPSLKDIRAKYTKSNKDILSRLGRPIDKVFSAKGGSVYYNLPDTLDKQAKQLSQNIRNGYSTRKWIESFWKPHLLDDPFGVVFMEMLPTQEAIAAKQEGRSFVYPTVKSITNIFDYLPKGNKLEYIIFELTKAQKVNEGLDENLTIYRLVDDAFDYYILKRNEDVTVMESYTLPNYFGEVPGMVNSDIIDPTNDNHFLSFYDEIIELADQFLMKGSIKITHDWLHGFPKYSEFANDCPACNSSGYSNGEKCVSCSGSGKMPITKVSDVKLLEWPNKEDAIILPTQVGGYISPDRNYYDMATADLRELESLMVATLWGTQPQQQNSKGVTSAETATEVMNDIKPQADRLTVISDMAEARHKFIIDNVIRIQLQPNYQGASVSYGRRFMLEGPDVIWLKYSDARVKGAPQSVLDTLLHEYYEANYMTDPIGLSVAKKMMYVEPFVHYTTINLKALMPDPEDFKAKLYFSEWLAMQSEGMLISLGVDELKLSLKEYAGQKNLEQPKQISNF